MARISELHYSNAYARNSGVSEFLEVALGNGEDPADFTVSFYEANGSVGFEITLDDPRVTMSVDPDNGEFIYVLSADNLPILLTDPNGSQADNYEAYALTNTGAAPAEVIDFYDIGGGTQNITATDGVAAGATSDNVQPPTGPNSATTTIQWNQPNPDQVVFVPLSPGDTGIACFTEGTLIETSTGPRRIETLSAGDLVQTRDAGVQPLRWIGHRRVVGQGAFAPILLRKGTLGAKRDLYVSPQHRLLLRGWQAELLFGDAEVLVAAKALVNDSTIRRVPMPFVTYVHLMFDHHQIVLTEGLESESFLPGGYILDALDAQAQAEILTLFPELEDGPVGYGTAARRICTPQEAQLFSATT